MALNNVKVTPKVKAVTFNTETLETSVGGTETPGRIKELSTIETPEGDCEPGVKMFKVSGNRSSYRSLQEKKAPLSKQSILLQSKSSPNMSPTVKQLKKSKANAEVSVKAVISMKNDRPTPDKTPKHRFSVETEVQATPEVFNQVTIETPGNHYRCKIIMRKAYVYILLRGM